MSEPTNAEKAAAYRLTAEYLDTTPYFPATKWAAAHIRVKADKLDSPPTPLPTERTWHPNVRANHPSPALPGALNVGEGLWVLLYPKEHGGYCTMEDHEVEVFEPEHEPEPRVVRTADPCPPVGTRWKQHGADLTLVVQTPGRCRWTFNSNQNVFKWSDLQPGTVFTEVLP